MNIWEKMSSGEIYDPGDEQVLAEQEKQLEKLYDYNHTRPAEHEKRAAMLQDMFGKIGKNCYIEPPLHANWAGRFVTLGNNVYANFGLTLVDDTNITIGDNVMMGPNVVLATAAHPISPELREKAYQYNLPIVIGRNCWLGAGAMVMPGVTIGENTVVGAGSVVTKDLPANVVAVGNPARILRPINDTDRETYAHGRKICL